MAQHKYELLTVPTAADPPRRHHPWYKERLRLKFINPSKQTAALNGQRWTFVANNMDDFRTGLPSKIRARDMVKQARGETIPVLSCLSQPKKEVRRPESKIMSSNPGLRTLYSKMGPRRQVQQERLEREKQSVLKHPLQLYPHLEDSIPVELLHGVIEVIEPTIKVNAQDECLSSGSSESLSCISSQEDSVERMSEVFSPDHLLNSPNRNIQSEKLYKFPLKQTKEEKERESLQAASQQVISASQQSRVDQVTTDLVQWMVELDCGKQEGQPAMDESTIKNLFSNDYESRPAQFAPVRVVELVNVPSELRLESRDYSRNGYSTSASLRYGTDSSYQYGRSRALTHPAQESEPRYVRSKYGAWYLPVDLWRPRPNDEPLKDPKEELTEADCEEAVKNIAMDEMLAELHGARTFKEFILTKKKGAPVPSFLRTVETEPKQHSIRSK